MFKKKPKLITFIAVLIIVVGSLVVWLINSGQSAPEAVAGWYDEGWLYRQQLVVDSTKIDADLTDFSVAVQFISTGTNPYSNTNSDGSDLRFTDNAGNLLKYEIETWDETGTSTVWVKLPTVDSGADTNFFMYYGNSSAQDAQDPKSVWDDNYMGVWHLDNTATGTNAFVDSTVNNNHGSGAGGVSLSTTDGPVDGAFSLDGSNDVIEIADDDTLDLTTQMTIEAWYYVSAAEEGSLVSHITSGGAVGWELDSRDVSGCKVFLYLDNSGGSQSCTVGQWNHAVGVYNGSNITVYINGVPGTPASYSDDATAVSTRMGIGARDIGSFSYFFTGNIDEVRVSNNARSAAHIKASYNSSNNTLLTYNSAIQGPGPVLYLSFDEGYGSTTYDQTPNNNDGTITGATWKDDSECKKGKCLYFDGDGDYVTSLNNIDISGSNDRTVSLWFKQSTQANKNIMGFGGNVDLQLFDFLLFNGTLIGHFHGSGNDTITGAPSYKLNEWNHAVIIYDGTSAKVYLNGRFANSKTISLNTTNSTVTIGGGKFSTYNYFQGFIDEVKIYNYVRTADQINQDFNQNFSTFFGASADQGLSDGLVGWWSMDESASSTCATATFDSCDASGNGNDGNWFNDTTATSTAKYGRAVEFDGTGDYASISDDNSLDLIDNFTVSLWIKPNNLTSSNDYFLSKLNTAGADNSYSVIWEYVDNTVEFYAGASEYTGDNPRTDSKIAISDTNWHHVVYSYDGRQWSGYRDGELIFNVSRSFSLGTGTGNLILGSFNTSANFYDGTLDEVRIYNRGLSPDEVRRLYEWAPGPVSHWKFDENTGTSITNDTAASSTFTGGNHGSMNGSMTEDDWVPGKYGSALELDGSNDSVTVTDPDAGKLDFGTGDFTLEAWFNYDTNLASDWSGIISKGGGGSVGYGIELSNSSAIACSIQATGGANQHVIGSVPSKNEWHHVACVFDRDDKVYVYLDGVLNKSSSYSAGNNGSVDTSNNLVLGSYKDAGQWRLNGKIDDVRIYNYARTPRQVLEDMHAGQRNNPIGYWSFDEGQGTTANDYGVTKLATGSGNNGTLTNMSTSGTSTVWTSYGKKSDALQFDGVNDYVSVSNFPQITVPFSMSFWVKLDSIVGWQTFIGRDTDNPASRAAFYFQKVDATFGAADLEAGTQTDHHFAFALTVGNNKVVVAESSFIPSTSTWYQLTATYDGDALKFYANGQLENTTFYSTSTLNQDSDLLIGAGWFNDGIVDYVDGIIDEVKIYNYVITLDEIRENYNQGLQTVLSRSPEEVQNISEGLVGWWKMDEPSWSGNTDEVIDYSGVGNHGTSVNSPNSTSTAKFGRAGEFTDGTSNGINVGSDGSLDFPLNDFTLSLWIKPESGANVLMRKGGGYSTGAPGYSIVSSGFQIGGTNKVIYNANPGGTTPNGEWSHLVYVVDRDGYLRKYINGALTGQVDISADANENITSSVDFYISAATSQEWVGLIDDVKIYNYARSPKQIMSEYVDSKPPVGYWKLDDRTGTTPVDNSGWGNDGTFTGSPTWKSSADCYFGSCLDFDGTDDEVTVSYANQIGLDVNQGSISAWIYWTGTSGWDNIVAMTNGSVSGYKLGVNSSNDAVTFFCLNPLGSAGAYAINFSDPNSLPREEWHHVAVTFEYATGTTARLYIDGVEVNNYTSVAACLKSTSGVFDIGHSSTTGLGSGYWQGKIDGLKIFNYPMTARQVALEYDGGGPVGYWKFDKGEGETAYDYSGNSNDGTVFVGTGGSNTATTTMWTNGATGKINGSLDFDGTDDYVGVSSGYSFDDKTEISISTWVKVNGGDNDYIIELPESGGGANGPGIHYNGGNIDYHIVTHSDNSFTDVNFTPVIGTWYHVLLTYDGVTLKGYKNGEFIGSHDVTLGTGIKHATGETNIGRFGSAGFNSDAQIDEVKIYNYALTPEEVRRDFNGGFATNFK